MTSRRAPTIIGAALLAGGSAWFGLRFLPGLGFGLPIWQTTSLVGLVAAVSGAALLLPGRRWSVPVAALATAAALLAASWVPVSPGPGAPDRGTPEPGFPARGLRVAAINLEFSRADPIRLRTELAALDPDLVVLAEADQQAVDGVLAALPRLELASDRPTGQDSGTAVLLDPRLGGRDAMITSTDISGPDGHQQPVVETDGLAVQAVHTIAPVDPADWRADLRRLRTVAETATDRPLIMAGDFNATTDHPDFRRLAAGGDDCRGSLLGEPTWPAAVPFARIDHILVFGGHCRAGGTFTVPGTDHRGIWADLILD